ncbi:hypothetical protein PT277_08840 [Acetobacteraceae bacterium ESL0709]|nr:hypothetical protein [Acetobacteraceae bacterium ESL0697]MDF7678788.1 hypothetical protein [Acetobacteraceae bacterium ESL0709]
MAEKINDLYIGNLTITSSGVSSPVPDEMQSLSGVLGLGKDDLLGRGLHMSGQSGHPVYWDSTGSKGELAYVHDLDNYVAGIGKETDKQVKSLVLTPGSGGGEASNPALIDEEGRYINLLREDMLNDQINKCSSNTLKLGGIVKSAQKMQMLRFDYINNAVYQSVKFPEPFNAENPVKELSIFTQIILDSEWTGRISGNYIHNITNDGFDFIAQFDVSASIGSVSVYVMAVGPV